MIDPFWLTLVAKMIASAALVIGASLVVERAGPLIGAMIATLPLSAGPNYVYLAMEHGSAFLAKSALASLVANAATGLFAAAYAALAQKRGLAASLGGAYAVWIAVVLLAHRPDWTLAALISANALVYAGAIAATRRFRAARPRAPAGRRWWDLPLRALAVMALVATVVLAGRFIGPGAAGVTALVPIVFTSLVFILHDRIGGPATAAVIAHSLPGMVGFTVAVIVLAVTVVPLGAAAALSLALLVSVAWNGALIVLQRLRKPAPQPCEIAR
ncbi:MAG: hypothetical protein ACJ8DM_00095 [Microvirga sp.]